MPAPWMRPYSQPSQKSAPNQAKATEETLAATKKLLDFVATFPDACIRYIASNMCLWIDSDSSFASIHNARKRTNTHPIQ